MGKPSVGGGQESVQNLEKEECIYIYVMYYCKM
jgi:hypothetical protein